MPSRVRTIGGLGAGAAAKLGATKLAVMSAAASMTIEFLATDMGISLKWRSVRTGARVRQAARWVLNEV